MILSSGCHQFIFRARPNGKMLKLAYLLAEIDSQIVRGPLTGFGLSGKVAHKVTDMQAVHVLAIPALSESYFDSSFITLVAQPDRVAHGSQNRIWTNRYSMGGLYHTTFGVLIRHHELARGGVAAGVGHLDRVIASARVCGNLETASPVP